MERRPDEIRQSNFEIDETRPGFWSRRGRFAAAWRAFHRSGARREGANPASQGRT